MRMSTVLVFAGLLFSMTGCKSKSEQYCRQALAETNQMATAMAQGMGGPAVNIPDEPFISRCKTLPEGAAHCAIPSYAMAHVAECQAFAAQLHGMAH